ncbi:hypothetical protein BaRGS_00025699 [Batillaria attramentaria]|uniref:Uncharacterized protein n=1 Tax=Batillaria attramentaria TaxID=370345 RepID=A0ABD0K6R3_9CAEN
MSAACGCDLAVGDVIKALEILLTPVTRLVNKEAVSEVLQVNLDTLNRHLCDSRYDHLRDALLTVEKHFFPPSITRSTEWNFVSTILQLLYILTVSSKRKDVEDSMHNPPETAAEGMKDLNLKPKRPQDAPPLSNTALSLTQINLVRNGLQFVARLGLCPNLNQGVGIPLQHRSKLLSASSIAEVCTDSPDEGAMSKRQKLCICISVLTLLLDVKDLGFLVTSAHLNDLLAGLLQLVYAYPASGKDTKILPGKNQEAEGLVRTSKEEGETNAVSADPGSHKIMGLPVDADYYRNCLSKVLSSVNPNLIIRELMVLQAGIPPRVQTATKDGSHGNLHSVVHPPPPWLRKACSQILQRMLSGPKGITHLYAAMAVGVEPSSPADWKCCEAVARVVSRCPVPSLQADQYVECVSKQLFEMLQLTKRSDTVHLLRLVGSVVNQMAAAHKERFHQHFFRPLMQHLTMCLEGGEACHDGQVVVEEDALDKCLDNLHKVCVVGQQPQAGVLSVLQPVVSVLWALFGVSYNGIYNIRRNVRELLVNYLKHLGSIQAAVCLRHLAIGGSMTETGNKSFPPEIAVRFEPGSSGGLKAVRSTRGNASGLGEKEQVEAAIDILGDLKSDGVTGELLVLLLKELTEMISFEAQLSDIVLPARVERSEVREQKVLDLERRVTLLHLLASICETFGSECLTDTRQILLFVKVSLERGVAVCKNTSEEEMAVFETETMSMAMGLLTTVLAGAIQMDEDHRTMMDEMLPLLAVIGQGHPDEFIREMASDIRIAIATRGAVLSSLQEDRSENKRRSASEEKAKDIKIPGHKGPSSKPLIEMLPDTSASGTEKVSSKSVHPVSSPTVSEQNDTASVLAQSQSSFQTDTDQHTRGRTTGISPNHHKTSSPLSAENSSSKTGEVPSEKSPLLKVFEQLCDPLIPMRGHGLMALTKLVQDRDSETLSKKDTVQKIFQENMHHGDSYLYLAAINGMSALADRFSESVVAALAEEFAGFAKMSSTAEEEIEQGVSADHRLKLGEVLMKAIRNLGEMVPQYRDVLLAAVLAGARDRDPAVRASSVSNLAELCQLLRFALAPVLQEVLSCCSSLLIGEETIVRRAAALTLAKILEGLDSDALTVLDSNLRDIYRLLKKLHEQDPDDAVRLHANMALVQLDSVARGYLFPKQTLQKKIQVLPDADTFK